MDSLQHVLWTPLARGRIEYLYVDLVDSKDIWELPTRVWGIRAELSTLFIENHKLLDQNELQRQQNEHRPELKALLKQFSDYI